MSETKTPEDLMQALLNAADAYAEKMQCRVQIKIRPHKQAGAWPKHDIDINNPKLPPSQPVVVVPGHPPAPASHPPGKVKGKPIPARMRLLGKPWEDLTHEEKKEISLQLSKQPVFGMDIAKLRWEKKPNGHWVNYDHTITAGTFGK